MARRNYNAFLKAARRTGGLSLPAARKAYKKISERLGRPAKGNDVKQHPRIFKQTISTAGGKRRPGFADQRTQGVRSAGRQRGAASRVTQQAPRGKAPDRTQRGRQASPRPARTPGVVLAPPAPVEYVSTPEYTKRGPKGRFHLQLQIHIIGPAGQSKAELDAIASDWLGGKGVPGGFQVKALEWNGKSTKDPRTMRVARSNFRQIPFTF